VRKIKISKFKSYSMLEKQIKRNRRHKRVRAKISGTAERPRLCVFRSAKHIYAQLIDDVKEETLVSASEKEISKIKIKKNPSAGGEKDKNPLSGKTALAFEVGVLIAKKAAEKKIQKVLFDRGGYVYHGRIKAVADGARQGGLIF
jgi:large subunit ribosomal protein L18